MGLHGKYINNWGWKMIVEWGFWFNKDNQKPEVQIA
jgi:hypothetical protein